MNLNRSLMQIIGFGWLGFLCLGIVINRLFAITQVTVLVDRAQCDRTSWQKVSDRYAELLRDHERRRIQLTKLVILSDLGAEVRDSLPTPAEFNALETYGEANPERVEQLVAGFPTVEVLSCRS